jgi:hypothetical protein
MLSALHLVEFLGNKLVVRPTVDSLDTLIPSETIPHFVLSALHLVEFPANKLVVRQAASTREGVVLEIEKLAELETQMRTQEGLELMIVPDHSVHYPLG